MCIYIYEYILYIYVTLCLNCSLNCRHPYKIFTKMLR